ncbi:MAG: von Willebrand factor type A domain-containing protein, partial [Calditrichia bacterium]|nr:von Willebrand factor type A domain-containing protein [Calditrichia bacterium]
MSMKQSIVRPFDQGVAGPDSIIPGHDTEEYDRIYENPFMAVVKNPLSTFSIDVDAASYANVRRFINSNQQPPKDAARIEEMINYFSYDYPQPTGKHPFSIITE